jgi:hypothetical protein
VDKYPTARAPGGRLPNPTARGPGGRVWLGFAVQTFCNEISKCPGGRFTLPPGGLAVGCVTLPPGSVAVGSCVLLFQVQLLGSFQIQYDNNITDLKQLNLGITYTLTKLEDNIVPQIANGVPQIANGVQLIRKRSST